MGNVEEGYGQCLSRTQGEWADDIVKNRHVVLKHGEGRARAFGQPGAEECSRDTRFLLLILSGLD